MFIIDQHLENAETIRRTLHDLIELRDSIETAYEPIDGDTTPTSLLYATTLGATQAVFQLAMASAQLFKDETASLSMLAADDRQRVLDIYLEIFRPRHHTR